MDTQTNVVLKAEYIDRYLTADASIPLFPLKIYVKPKVFERFQMRVKFTNQSFNAPKFPTDILRHAQLLPTPQNDIREIISAPHYAGLQTH